MGNSWGTNQGILAVTKMTADININCNPGVETNVLGIGGTADPLPTYADSNGNYQPVIAGVLTIVLGGTPPSSLVIGFRIGSAVDSDTYTVEPGLLEASAELVIPVFLIGVPSTTLWLSPGSTPHVSILVPDFAVTSMTVGSRAQFQLWRVPG